MICRRLIWALSALLIGTVLSACSPVAPAPTPEPPTSTVVPTAPPKPTATVTAAPTATPQIIYQSEIVTVTVTMDPTTQGCAEIGDTVVIGAILPLSSPGAMRNGFAMQTALNIALNDVNSLGGIHGRPAQLITYDSAGIPSRGARYAEQLILHDCARAIVGLYHSNVASAVSQIAAQYGVPLILAEAAADELTNPEATETFRIVPSLSMINSMDARWLDEVGDYNGDGVVTAAIIAEDTHFGQFHIEQSERWLAEYGIELNSFVADMPTDDFSPVIVRILDMETLPDALFIKVQDDSAYSIHRQLLDAGIGPDKGTLIVTNGTGLDDERFWSELPDGVGTVVKKIGPWHTTATPIGQLLSLNYAQTFDRWPERFAFGAYDAFMLAADAMERAPTLAPSDVITALQRADAELASGRYYFLAPDDPLLEGEASDSLWRQWPDVQTLFLQYTEPLQPAKQMAVIWPERYRTGAIPTLE